MGKQEANCTLVPSAFAHIYIRVNYSYIVLNVISNIFPNKQKETERDMKNKCQVFKLCEFIFPEEENDIRNL